jgi:DNA repair exonuclease SbcCD ATPase subunit
MKDLQSLSADFKAQLADRDDLITELRGNKRHLKTLLDQQTAHLENLTGLLEDYQAKLSQLELDI